MPDHESSADARERERLHLLDCSMLLDTPASEEFDQITRLTSQIFDMPVSLVTFVDADRQWFKSRLGFPLAQTDRASSFCTRVVETADVMVVEDTALDPRFEGNFLVTGEPCIRFYAGAPLLLDSGHVLGTLCVLDHRPRTFSPQQRDQLATLARMTMAHIELHQRAGRVNAVTRLPNRAQLFQDLRARPAGTPSALMLVEIMDHERMLAESRAVGIEPLESLAIAFAARLRQLAGPGVAVYHVGEMRFCMEPAGNTHSQREAFAAAALARLAGPMASGGRVIELAPMAGLVEFDPGAVSPGDALRMAGAALYSVLGSGAVFAWHDAALDAAHRRAYRLMRDISPALARGEFRLVYQPKLNLRAGAFTGVESLARWRHPELGDVSPGEFIPLVEGGALIHEFTRWVLRTALEQLARWHGQGIELTMAVNVSSRNLEQSAFVDDVRLICMSAGVDPRYLHVECTENAVMTSARTQAALEAIRAMGVQISLDDFGMGYSNLACLRRLPVELLKLDQSLVQPIDGDTRAWLLVQSLISLGHALGYRILAEGVETGQAFSMLAGAGCDAVQGYHLSRPLEAEAIPEFLRVPLPEWET
ncbi:sensor domain-containing phosphodiesterase [Paracidovorax cattleyae]|nr:GGDEF domain-containing phosphodiesterase [Paracidovorax cattleyae]AVS74950.1 phosphodiesterase [Paracidovorax cattleyae]